MGINYLARTPNKAVFTSLQHDLDSQGAQVVELRKIANCAWVCGHLGYQTRRSSGVPAGA
jgi:hypothetical protein